MIHHPSGRALVYDKLEPYFFNFLVLKAPVEPQKKYFNDDRLSSLLLNFFHKTGAINELELGLEVLTKELLVMYSA
jgi:hypothetical protein